MNQKFKVTAADQEIVSRASARLLKYVAATVKIEPSLSLEIGGKPYKKEFNSPGGMGILPFAMTATKAELQDMIEKLELLKYKYTEVGDYYAAWRAKGRQNLLLGVLSGMTTFSLNKV